MAWKAFGVTLNVKGCKRWHQTVTFAFVPRPGEYVWRYNCRHLNLKEQENCLIKLLKIILGSNLSLDYRALHYFFRFGLLLLLQENIIMCNLIFSYKVKITNKILYQS
jgi:hypothetical protein